MKNRAPGNVEIRMLPAIARKCQDAWGRMCLPESQQRGAPLRGKPLSHLSLPVRRLEGKRTVCRPAQLASPVTQAVKSDGKVTRFRPEW